MAWAADDYPNKTIRLIIPYTPGGSIDNTGRLVAEQLQKQLGQAIVVENQPGASGLVGTLAGKRAQADGYTLLFNASSQVYLPLVVAKKTYDAEADFTPVGQIDYVPLLVVVNNDVPVKNLAELTKLAKSTPGKYTWATSGLGITSHLSEELFNRELAMAMDIITYKGAFVPAKSTPEQFKKLIHDDLAKIGKIIKDAKIKPQGLVEKTGQPALVNILLQQFGLPHCNSHAVDGRQVRQQGAGKSHLAHRRRQPRLSDSCKPVRPVGNPVTRVKNALPLQALLRLEGAFSGPQRISMRIDRCQLRLSICFGHRG